MSYRVAGHAVTPVLVIAAAATLAATIAVAVVTGTSGWFVALGLIGPDLAFLAAIGQKVPAPGRVPSRVIPVYNALHRFIGPVVLAGLSLSLVAFPSVAAPVGVVALAWLCHVVWDRSVGYGLRDRDGAIIAPRGRRSREPEHQR